MIRRCAIVALSALATVLLASGCTIQSPTPAPRVEAAKAEEAPPAKEEAPVLAFAAPAPPPPAAEPKPAAAAVARMTTAVETPLNDDPSQVMGLEPAALESLLGQPEFKRVEPPAEVWQYRGEACVLDVILYTEGAAGPFRVTYYEIRGAAADASAKRRCFRALLLARGPT